MRVGNGLRPAPWRAWLAFDDAVDAFVEMADLAADAVDGGYDPFSPLAQADHSADLQLLATPVTGGGVSVGRIQHLFLSGIAQNGVDPVEHVWARLYAQGQSLLEDGQPRHGAEAHLAELRLRLAALNEKLLPVLKQLGFV